MTAEAGDLGWIAEASHTDPFAFDVGVSRTIGLFARHVDRLTADTSDLDTELEDLRLEFGYPIGPRQSVGLGLALRETFVGAVPGASAQLTSWIAANGDPMATANQLSTEFTELDLLFRWRYDTRDHEFFPGQGLEQSLDARAALPVSDVDYFAVRYDARRYWMLGDRWTTSVHGVAAYGDALADTTALPPYLNWSAGGPSTVRGYRGLGPKDSLGNPYGGNLLLATQLELKTAWPRRWAARMRSGFFLDVGNVYSTDGTVFLDGGGQPLDHGFRAAELKSSAGAAVDLLMPFGTVRFSYAFPLNPRDNDADPWLNDRTERFQISFGVEF
jgi:outer membrane protein insertion porin family